jgi:hypothetical protein
VHLIAGEGHRELTIITFRRGSPGALVFSWDLVPVPSPSLAYGGGGHREHSFLGALIGYVRTGAHANALQVDLYNPGRAGSPGARWVKPRKVRLPLLPVTSSPRRGSGRPSSEGRPSPQPPEPDCHDSRRDVLGE